MPDAAPRLCDSPNFVADASPPHCAAQSMGSGSQPLPEAPAIRLQLALQRRTQLDPSLTLVSVDVTAAHDLISRQAMLRAFLRSPEASALLPFMRLWYARASSYVWAAGPDVHRVTQEEGGEQGDPLMLAVFSLGLASALHALQHKLCEALRQRPIAAFWALDFRRRITDLSAHHAASRWDVKQHAGAATLSEHGARENENCHGSEPSPGKGASGLCVSHGALFQREAGPASSPSSRWADTWDDPFFYPGQVQGHQGGYGPMGTGPGRESVSGGLYASPTSARRPKRWGTRRRLHEQWREGIPFT